MSYLDTLTEQRDAAYDKALALRDILDDPAHTPTEAEAREFRDLLDVAERAQRKINDLDRHDRLTATDYTPATIPATMTGYGPVEDGYILRANQRLAEHVHATDADRKLDFGRMLRGAVTGDWSNAWAEQRAMGTSGASAIVPAPVAAQFIDRARNAARVLRAGARTVRMDSSTLKVPRLTGSSAPAWRSEGGAIATGDLTLDAVTLTARSLAFMVTLNRELVMDSSPEALNIVVNDLAAQVALEWDRVALRGSGAPPEPEGVRNASGVTVVEAGSGNGQTIANLGWDFLLSDQGIIRAANFEPNAAIYGPRTDASLAALKDTTGQYIRPPAALESVARYATAQVPINLTVGSSSDCSEVYLGQWDMLYLGVREEPMTMQLLELHAGTGQQDVIIHFRGDIAVAQPAAFVLHTGVRG